MPTLTTSDLRGSMHSVLTFASEVTGSVLTEGGGLCEDEGQISNTLPADNAVCMERNLSIGK